MPETDEAFAAACGRAERLVTGEAIRGVTRDALMEETETVGVELLDRFAGTCAALHALAPRSPRRGSRLQQKLSSMTGSP
jgi:hypothetical protein